MRDFSRHSDDRLEIVNRVLRIAWLLLTLLIVPPAYPEAMNLNMLEYSWAQGLIVASHSLRYVFCNNPCCDSMPLASVAEQLDTIRRTLNLSMIPSSEYYMANCRALHLIDVPGPTAVSGWKRSVSGQPYVHSVNILRSGDSGSDI